MIAHDVRFTPDGGVVDFRHGEPCPVCGEECKRSVVDAMRDGREVAYVGDGYSDRCASKAADIRFARRTLAEHLDREGVDYTGSTTSRPSRTSCWGRARRSARPQRAAQSPEAKPASMRSSSSSVPIRTGPLNQFLAESTHHPPKRRKAPPTVSGA